MRFALPLPLPLALALAVTAAGCGTAPLYDTTGNPDVLRAWELDDRPELNAFEFIRRARPLWLNDRQGEVSPAQLQRPDLANDIANPPGIKVYVDGVYSRDGVDVLRRYRTIELREMRRLDGGEATTRFGVGHRSGAILVATLR